MKEKCQRHNDTVDTPQELLRSRGQTYIPREQVDGDEGGHRCGEIHVLFEAVRMVVSIVGDA